MEPRNFFDLAIRSLNETGVFQRPLEVNLDSEFAVYQIPFLMRNVVVWQKGEMIFYPAELQCCFCEALFDSAKKVFDDVTQKGYWCDGYSFKAVFVGQPIDLPYEELLKIRNLVRFG